MSYDPSGSESSVHNELYGLTYERMYIILMNKPMDVELTPGYVYWVQSGITRLLNFQVFKLVFVSRNSKSTNVGK